MFTDPSQRQMRLAHPVRAAAESDGFNQLDDTLGSPCATEAIMELSPFAVAHTAFDHTPWADELPSDAFGEADDVQYQQVFKEVDTLLQAFQEMNCPIELDEKVLDLGSGEGKMVYAFRRLGRQAFGADFVRPSQDVERRMKEEGLLGRGAGAFAVMPSGSNRIPFENDFFDCVVSWNVMEHVNDHAATMSEICRVLKPGGRSLHYFPSRYRIIEHHIDVPLASIFQTYSYLLFWAAMGLRDKTQKGLSVRETARRNCDYLRDDTNYLKDKELKAILRRHFINIESVEKHLWKRIGGKSSLIYNLLSRARLMGLLPIVASTLSRFGYRAIFFCKPGPEDARNNDA